MQRIYCENAPACAVRMCGVRARPCWAIGEVTGIEKHCDCDKPPSNHCCAFVFLARTRNKQNFPFRSFEFGGLKGKIARFTHRTFVPLFVSHRTQIEQRSSEHKRQAQCALFEWIFFHQFGLATVSTITKFIAKGM